MKKVLFVAAVLMCLVMIIAAADFRTIPQLLDPGTPSKKCAGYTIIEYDKGIDCNGDTIQLTRQNGFAEKVIGSKQERRE